MTILLLGLFIDTKNIRSPLIGKNIPQFILSELSSGNSFNNDMLPTERYLINVWASWCLECIREHQQLRKIHKEGKIKIIGINYKDNRSDALGWLEIYGNPYIYNLYDNKGELGINLGVYGVPETFFIDNNGIIIDKYIGAITQDIYNNRLIPLLQKIDEDK
jgi:cytochrome c biogenesis protein CcmG/thiol:disulfide interchange protein DsbE